MAVKIDEQWIRQRVHLKHDKLDDVKSLALPGSYHEKVTHLGTALQSFTRLKHLDLSRNALCNLEGLSHLNMLENLNLYYNNISSLKDLYLLKSLVNLKELDIRLNPVTKNEPDHRLFLVHMLPNLTKLDDRSVRDSERKAALMHFTTDQASGFTEENLYVGQKQQFDDRLTVPRAELVKNLGPKGVLENDDILLLDTLTKKSGDLSRPNPITGSVNKLSSIKDYPKQELHHMYTKDGEGVPYEPPGFVHHLPPQPNPTRVMHSTKTGTSHTKHNKGAVDHTYAPFAAQGNFTPTPKRRSTYYEVAEHDDDGFHSDSRSNGIVSNNNIRKTSTNNGFMVDQQRNGSSSNNEEHLPVRSSEKSTVTSQNKNFEYQVLQQLIDLVDKYWNGSKSLHHHAKFTELATGLLRSYQERRVPPEDDIVGKLQREMKIKEEELARLSEHFEEQQEECQAIRNDLENERIKQTQFDVANEELTTLHARFKQGQDENKKLKAAMQSQENAVLERRKQSDEVAVEYQLIRDENKTLRQQFQQQSVSLQQLNELTNMLQESHRSLVATNDHLLLELAQEKDRHQNEVSQLHWSYKQLKKSIDWIPNTDKGYKT